MSEAIPVGPKKSQQSSSRRWLAVASVLAAVLVALPAAAGLAWWQERGPDRRADGATTTTSAPEATPPTGSASTSRTLPLRGVPLGTDTGLRLLVADSPAPFVLDVDRRTIQPITGLPTNGERGVTVAAVGEDALVLSHRFCNRCGLDQAGYVVRRGSTAAMPLGRMMEAVPSLDGEGVSTLNRENASRCAIREVDLDGSLRRAARPAPCRTDLIAELPAGLLVSSVGPLGRNAHSALLEPNGEVVRLGEPSVQPVVGNLVLTGADRHTPLVLHDVGSGVERTLSWPSKPGYSLGEVTGDPSGRLAVVAFAKFSPEHKLDLWLLDTQTRRWQQLPAMPAHIVPKFVDVEWSADGRVVILYGNVLGVWRPGSPLLGVGRVKAPRRNGGNFVVW